MRARQVCAAGLAEHRRWLLRDLPVAHQDDDGDGERAGQNAWNIGQSWARGQYRKSKRVASFDGPEVVSIGAKTVRMQSRQAPR